MWTVLIFIGHTSVYEAVIQNILVNFKAVKF